MKSIYHQLDEGAPNLRTDNYSNDGSDFRVPVCDDQTCKLTESGSRKDIDDETPVSHFSSQEGRQTASSTGLAGDQLPVISKLEDLWDSSRDFSSDCGILLSPPSKRPRLHEINHESKEDDTRKSKAMQRELYLVWNAPSKCQSELANKSKYGKTINWGRR